MSLDITTQPRVYQDRFSLFNSSRILRADTALDDADIQLEVKAQRMRRKRPELTYEFTRDPGLIHQYHVVRQKMYAEMHGVDHYPGGKNEFDDISHTLVVRSGNFVVGGVRLTPCTSRLERMLPLESEDFRLRDVCRI